MPLITASLLSTIQKQGLRTKQKTCTVPRRLAPSTENTEVAGGALWPAAGMRGRSRFLETHPDQRPERKSRLSCPCPEFSAFFWPLAQLQSAVRALLAEVP